VPALGPGTLALLVFLLAASATARLRASR